MVQIELHNKIEKIEKLKYFSTFEGGNYWVRHPTVDEVVDKINELIDILNGETNDSNS